MSLFKRKTRMIPLRVKDIMVAPPITIRHDQTVDEAVKILWENRIGSLPVVDEEGNLIGIVTERDLCYCGVRNLFGKGIKVSEIMTENPITVKPNAPIDEAVRLMREAGIRHLPVVEDSKPVGVVSMRDIVDLAVMMLHLWRE